MESNESGIPGIPTTSCFTSVAVATGTVPKSGPNPSQRIPDGFGISSLSGFGG